MRDCFMARAMQVVESACFFGFHDDKIEVLKMLLSCFVLSFIKPSYLSPLMESTFYVIYFRVFSVFGSETKENMEATVGLQCEPQLMDCFTPRGSNDSLRGIRNDDFFEARRIVDCFAANGGSQ